MDTERRTTVYLDPKLLKALKLKSVEENSSVSAIINQCVRISLAEDLDDLSALKKRRNEKRFEFKDVLNELRRDGRL